MSLEAVISDVLDARVDEGEFAPQAGLAVVVCQEGEVLHMEMRGLADRRARVPVTEETLFSVGSLTKAFTALAFVIIADEGVIDLDAPVAELERFPGFSDARVQREATIRDVLCHRTGLPSNDLIWALPTANRSSVLSAIPRLEVPSASFRQQFSYNNVLYAALGACAEERTGVSYERFVAERILEPLGMRRSLFWGADASWEGLARPTMGDVEMEPRDISPVQAAAGLVTTPADMAKWLNFWCTLDGEETGPLHAIRSRLLEPQQRLDPPNPLLSLGLDWAWGDTQYGLGWVLSERDGLRLAHHVGMIDGFSSVVILVPEHALGIAVLSNVNLSAVPGELARVLVEEGVGMRLPSLAPASSFQVQGPDDVSPQRLEQAPDAIRDWIGLFEDAAFGQIEVIASDDASGFIIRRESLHWPLAFLNETTATFEIEVMGLRIPMSADFAQADDGTPEIAIPLSMDPAVGPRVFRAV